MCHVVIILDVGSSDEWCQNSRDFFFLSYFILFSFSFYFLDLGLGVSMTLHVIVINCHMSQKNILKGVGQE